MTRHNPARLAPLCVAISLFVVSCGAPADTGPTPAPTSTEPKILRVYALDAAPIRPVIDILTKNFTQKHPEYTVKIEEVQNDPVTELPPKVSAGALPDVIWTIDSMTPALIDAGVFLDLREIVKLDPSFKTDDINPVALAAVSAENNPGLFVVPASLETVQMYYNKTMFTQAGAPLPAPDWTWDDLIAACQVIQAANNKVKCLNFSSGGLLGSEWWAYWTPWVVGQGGSVLSSDKKTSTLSTFESLAGLQAYVNLWTKYKIVVPPNQRGDCFVEQTCAVSFFVTAGVPMYTQRVRNAFQWDTQLMPAQPKGRLTGTDVYGFGVGKTSKNREAAWEFVKYLATPDAQRAIVSAGLGMPMLNSMSGDPAVKQLPAAMRVFLEGAQYGILPPAYPAKCGNLYTGQIQQIFTRALRSAIEGGAKIEEVFKAADAAIQPCLEGN